MVQRYVRIKTNREQVYYGVLLANRSVVVYDAPPWLGGQETDQVQELDTYQLLAPCFPSKIIAVGKNYLKHAAEMGTPVPDEPLLFLKPPTTIEADAANVN
ncbi:MAG: Rv2993c-like domain-containing protein, partial [Cyanobacteria bacterium J06648_1]